MDQARAGLAEAEARRVEAADEYTRLQGVYAKKLVAKSALDKAAAAASRRRVLDMIATDRIPAVGYHMPFPALGFVEAVGDGFRWVPEQGQFIG